MVNYKSIPKNENDFILNEWGYDLMEEYFELISATKLSAEYFVLDIATGTGRAASILSRMGYNVITGDYNYNFKFESENRITKEYLNKVNYIKLNLEKNPFKDNSIENIICIDTFHELNNPFLCLNEIIRIHSPNGKLLIADFNSKGFDVIDKLYKIKYNKLHTRGKISLTDLESILISNYSEIKIINTKLNKGFIAWGKRNAKQ